VGHPYRGKRRCWSVNDGFSEGFIGPSFVFVHVVCFRPGATPDRPLHENLSRYALPGRSEKFEVQSYPALFRCPTHSPVAAARQSARRCRAALPQRSSGPPRDTHDRTSCPRPGRLGIACRIVWTLVGSRPCTESPPGSMRVFCSPSVPLSESLASAQPPTALNALLGGQR
jgi:hypothetical protein